MNNGIKPIYLDAAMPAEDRVTDLIHRMTLDEKIGQMGMLSSAGFLANDRLDPELIREKLNGVGIGAVENPRLAPEKNLETINRIQKILKENTRLGIPALVIAETLHGLVSPEATVFPQAIGLACTWNTGIVSEIASSIAKEARSVGVTQGLAPDLDLARDPRWGRVEETYGEDPYLCSRFGVEYIKGLQGTGTYVDSEHLAATVKHFAAHGSPEGGVNLAPVSVGERQLRELYLPPFKAAVQEAGVLSVMPAYSEFDGIPCSASRLLLKRILREEWGFVGYLFSDYGAIEMLVSFHHTAEDPGQAAEQAVLAGMDMEAPDVFAFGAELANAVRDGRIGEDVIDGAVARILRVKFLTGLFENPFADPEYQKAVLNCEAHKNLALRSAHEAAVLLKNERKLLPIDQNINSIAVIGPNADWVQLGDYSMEKENAVTVLQGLRNRASRNTEIKYAKGCDICGFSKDGFEEAVNLAKSSTVAILAVGESSAMNFGIGWGVDNGRTATCGEGFDRCELGLPGVQQELVEEIAKTGTPVIVVLINGRPLETGWLVKYADAVIEAWYPGEEGGNALADIIFGRVNPSGRLAVSFPRTVGHVPVYYNCKPSSRGYYKMPGSPWKPGRDYVFDSTGPLFEFGFGLSYTSFEYSDLRIIPERIAPSGEARVKVKVKNSGDREGMEVVQLYINDVVSSVTTPVKALKGFKKISLEPGEVKELEFILTHRELSIYDEDMKCIVEPGIFEIMTGNLKGVLFVEDK